MPYREEKFRGLQFRGCEKDIFEKKKRKKQTRKGEKYFIDLPPQYAVTVRILRLMCKIFTQLPKLLYPSSLTHLAQIILLHCQYFKR